MNYIHNIHSYNSAPVITLLITIKQFKREAKLVMK